MAHVIDRWSLPERSMARLRRRGWPLAVTVASAMLGMAYTLWWGPVVDHRSLWITPGDLWATYRSAHYVGWGYLGGVYSAGTGLVTFPGILLVLAPVAMLTGALGLTEAFPRYLTHPTAWLALGPCEMLVSAVALFACDAAAERLGVSRAMRRVLCVAEACVLWNVAVIWGHPEDAVAVGLALYALVLVLDGRWTGAGWLFGAALATQPLVVLMFPVLLAVGGRRHAAGLTFRGLAPAIALILTPLIAQFHVTAHALFDQPNFPRIDHATPWTSLAPVIGGSGRNLAVAAGPGRIVAVVLACCLGWWARRWRQRPEMIVWAAALALALRCFSESVMVAFYVWPALALALVAAARAGRGRLVVATALALGTTVITMTRWGELPWWAAVTTGIVAVLLTAIHRAERDTGDACAPAVVRDRGEKSPDREAAGVLVGAMR
jgi:hypothetical protein